MDCPGVIFSYLEEDGSAAMGHNHEWKFRSVDHVVGHNSKNLGREWCGLESASHGYVS